MNSRHSLSACLLPACAVLTACGLFFAAGRADAAGWIPLANPAPGNVQLMLLLTDGTVMAADSGISNSWYKLTPDKNGSYVNGKWSTLATMADTRLYYSSCILRDGRVFVAGGEYGIGGLAGPGSARAEIYNPQTDIWTSVNVPRSLLDPTKVAPGFLTTKEGFLDSSCVLLPDGRVLIAPVAPHRANGTLIYDPVSNTFADGPAVGPLNQNEASWVKLRDDSILTVDAGLTSSERYIPATNTWVNDGSVPVSLYDTIGTEIGAAFLLPDGKAFFLGATGNSAIYTPTGTAAMGNWVAGPTLPNVIQYPLDADGNEVPTASFSTQGAPPDAAGAMMINGRILCALSGQLYNDARVGTTPSGATNTFWSATAKNPQYPAPTTFFVYDPIAKVFDPITGPTGATDDVAAYKTMMLDLPDGSVLYAHQNTDLYVYALDPAVPAEQPLAAGKPTIGSISMNPDGSFHLTGTGLNGISQGAAYGDDAQMDTNYPIVRVTAVTGEVTYGRTFNWSSTGVQTGAAVVSTDYVLPPILGGGGTVSLAVIANGIASDPITFAVVNPAETLTLNGATSAGSGTYNVKGGITEVQHGTLGVTSTLARTVGGKLQLLNSATAATATITIGGGPGNGGSGGVVEFRNQTTAASAVITSGSGVLGPNFDELTPNPIDGFGGAANFYDTALAGTAHFTNHGEAFRGGTGGSAGFFNNASADHGVFANKAATFNLGRGGVTQFTDTATAGFGTFTNDGSGGTSDFSGGETIFFLSSNAGNGTFINKGATLYQSALTRYAAAGATRFLGSSSAASGKFINEGAGYQVARGVTQFFDTSTAGTGTFTNLAGANGGGAVEFYEFSTAGDGVFTNDTTSPVLTAGGEFSFNDNSKAGTGHFTSTGNYGGHVVFNDQSSADHGTIFLTPNQPNNRIDFKGNSTAGNSILQIGAAGLVAFQANATAANATITIGASAVGSPVSSGPAQGAFFSGTAGSAQISVRGGEIAAKQGSILSFYNAESTAGNATISVSGAKNGAYTGGSVIFNTGSHAANATLIASGEADADIGTAGTISFRGGAKGDRCRVIINAGGWFDCSDNAIYGGTAIGSIEGAGRINLGAGLLTVGSTDATTVHLGPITQGGSTPGNGGKLTKTGTGTFTLAGASTYKGLTTINAGALAVDGSIMGNVQVNAGGTLQGTGTIGGTVTVAPGGIVSPGNSPGTLTVGGDYSQGPQGILVLEIRGPEPENQDHLIVAGNVRLEGTVIFVFGYSPSAGDTFPVIQTGGSYQQGNLEMVFAGLRPGFASSFTVVDGKLTLKAVSSGQLRNASDPIQSLNPAFSRDSGFAFPVFAIAGKSYRFEASTDLQNWITVSEKPGANNLLLFRETPAAGIDRRYYRVVQLP